ncbi:hypothetical protein HYH02_015227 [Chlamydomonas schloesseri]|uniref:1,4-alpha-glucan branching enzyme n=1 Tax=Chlamydomonas schloesseri TaxID=2026947 RepID=A0A835SKS0_9CHLO|nr:hypothetical protein HYH02_015227 [Chlamydomonas schloesseri]|eukprot:KAG2424144.1 hypothetical protein HYH02_015227 [Chlamydomonas schloesseri]
MASRRDVAGMACGSSTRNAPRGSFPRGWAGRKVARQTPTRGPVPLAAAAAPAMDESSYLAPPAPQTFAHAPHLIAAAPSPYGRGAVAVPDGSGAVSVKVWAPHAASVSLLLRDSGAEVPLHREWDDWSAVLAPGALSPDGGAYCFRLTTHDGHSFTRRDPYARATEYTSDWCFVDNPAAFQWSDRPAAAASSAAAAALPPVRHIDVTSSAGSGLEEEEVELAAAGEGQGQGQEGGGWRPRPFDEYIIYECCVGSFTPEGTLAAAAARLEHVAAAGFTAVQLMPLCEFSDMWGYNPRLLMSLHGKYGTPEDMRRFVDRAHQLGLGVIIDVVLHHGAVDGNSLWEYDGWGPDYNGGIYHEGGHDTMWGRGFAFWKREVYDMVQAACVMWLGDYRCDGLRFDSANDLPRDTIQALTYNLRERFPGRILTAEVTPENPQSVHELGFDSVWVHSGYFDIIQQHRALGRGHHGGGDWAEGWNLPRLRTVMVLHYGFTAPTQCIKYLLGSHDQVGCHNGGAWYQDLQMIGGRKRYAVDQYGGGRGDWHARSCSRLWWAANVAAAGLPMAFMGTEFAQSGWWDNNQERGLNWEHTQDEVGAHMLALFAAANGLRARFPALRRGWANILHEDRANGVVAFERVIEGETRLVCVINAGRRLWTGSDYGVWVGHAEGRLEEVLNSQSPEFGGNVEAPSGLSNEPRPIYDGKIWINLPQQATLIFQHML